MVSPSGAFHNPVSHQLALTGNSDGRVLGISCAQITCDECNAYKRCMHAVQLDESVTDNDYTAEVHFGAVDLEGFEEGSTETFRVSTASCASCWWKVLTA